MVLWLLHLQVWVASVLVLCIVLGCACGENKIEEMKMGINDISIIEHNILCNNMMYILSTFTFCEH